MHFTSAALYIFIHLFFRSVSPVSAVSSETLSIRANSLPRPTSPSPSVVSEKNEIDLQVNIKHVTKHFDYYKMLSINIGIFSLG